MPPSTNADRAKAKETSLSMERFKNETEDNVQPRGVKRRFCDNNRESDQQMGKSKRAMPSERIVPNFCSSTGRSLLGFPFHQGNRRHFCRC